MRIKRLPEAEKDIRNQLEYVAQHNPDAAVALGDAIDTAILRLADHPRLGRLGRVRETRELVVARTPYVIVYRFDLTDVRILRVLHGAQRWPPRRSERRRPRGLV
jgi:toxin ParE1/3/4